MRTSLNSELLSAESRGKKHIPVAVLAVILIHIVLFLLLLIAAGCRVHSRARQQGATPEQLVKRLDQPQQGLASSAERSDSPAAASKPIVATEPPINDVSAPVRPVTPEVLRPTARSAPNPKIYVVQPGETLGEIARTHGTTVKALKIGNQLKSDMIRPGQKLRVKPAPISRRT